MMRKSTLTVLGLLLLCFTTFVISGRNRVKVFHSVEKIGQGVLNGPESLVWDSTGHLYTSVNDGTIRKIDKVTGEISIYAYTEPNLTAEQRALCGTSVLYETVCGRPLGLQFDSQDNLWVADAYKGVLKIPRQNPSNVQLITNTYNGVPLKMPNSVYLTKDEKTLYFTDSSQLYQRFQFVAILIANKPDGRLFKLNLETGTLSVEISDMKFANGIAPSPNEDFLMICESGARQVRKYYVKGPRRGRNEVVVDDIGGYNDNIKPDGNGNYYIGLFSKTSEPFSAITDYPELQNLALQYIPPASTLTLFEQVGLIKKIDSRGRVIETIKSANSSVWVTTAEADIHEGYMYLGSVLNNYIAKFKVSDLKDERP